MVNRTAIDVDSYVATVRSSPCFICGIVQGSGQHRIVYENDDAIAFLNRFPTVPGYVLVCPKDHKTSVVQDFTENEYLQLQSLVRRVGLAVSRSVPTDRLYVLSLGSNEGNAHVHWHVAALPPDTPYEKQQFAALMFETSGGYLEYSDRERERLARIIEGNLHEC